MTTPDLCPLGNEVTKFTRPLPPEVFDAVQKHLEDSRRYRPYYKTAADLGILLDDDLALCSSAAFEALLDYSESLPTGKYEGKVWKCLGSGKRGSEECAWLLGEYRLDPDPVAWMPDILKIVFRRLEVVA